ncbi:putative transcription factor C2H2 family [Helianthus annuus]|nr:putative transcription factor C2H2 family [Helianthus annuus]
MCPQATSARSATGGIKKKAIQTFPVVNYWHGLQLPGLSNECAICLGDFAKGEQIRILPKCNHGYHVRCIDKWLSSHSSCPTCRQSLSGICEKILTGGNYSSTTSSQSEEQSASNTLIISGFDTEVFALLEVHTTTTISASIFPLMAMACHHYMIFTLQRVFCQTPRVPTIVVTQNQAAAIIRYERLRG